MFIAVTLSKLCRKNWIMASEVSPGVESGAGESSGSAYRGDAGNRASGVPPLPNG